MCLVVGLRLALPEGTGNHVSTALSLAVVASPENLERTQTHFRKTDIAFTIKPIVSPSRKAA